MTDTLTLITGSTIAFDFVLRDEQDGLEDLSTVDAAHLDVRESVDASTAVLELSVGAGTLTVVAAASKIQATPSQAQMDALTPGEYVADLAVRFGTKWRHTDRFFVRVLDKVSDHS